jgi:ABC-type transporter Mla subunit MlaD
VPPDDSDYDRGVAAGEILQRLAGHDQHFARINGSVDRSADRLDTVVTRIDGLMLAVQRLGDTIAANEATVVTTAQALKEAKEASDKASERHWTPFQRWVVAIGALAALIAAVGYFLHR